MRAPFNDLADLFQGPGGFSPGSFIGQFPCRYVTENAIQQFGPGSPYIVAYLTIEGYAPRGSWVAPFYGVDADLSDRVVVASRPLDVFWVVFTDVINWHGQTEYFRSYLAMEPAPPMGPMGGILLGGSASIYSVRVVDVEGGVLLGGAAAVSFNDVIQPSGGVLLGGTATVAFTWVIQPSGGVLLGGTATVAFTPGVFVLDTFTGSNGTVITSRSPDVGPQPTSTLTNYKISSNKARNSVDVQPVGSIYIPWVYESMQANCTVEADITSADINGAHGGAYDLAGIFFRYSNDNNNWWAAINTGTLALLQTNGGIVSAYATVAQPMADGVTFNLKVVLNTSLIQVYVNGVLKLGAINSFNLSATKHGAIIYASAAGGLSTVDNFKVY